MYIPAPILYALGAIVALVCLGFLPAWLMGLSEWQYARKERREKEREKRRTRTWRES